MGIFEAPALVLIGLGAAYLLSASEPIKDGVDKVKDAKEAVNQWWDDQHRWMPFNWESTQAAVEAALLYEQRQQDPEIPWYTKLAEKVQRTLTAVLWGR